MIYVRPEFWVGARRLRMLSLSGNGRKMSLPPCGVLRGACANFDAPMATVVTDSVVVVGMFVPGVIDIVNVSVIHVVYGAVIEEVSIVPTAAVITPAPVAETVVDPAIEAYGSAPVAFVKAVSTVSSTPVARRPKKTLFGRHYPRARHPVIIGNAVVIRPVTRGPQITITGTIGLLVDEQGRRVKRDGYP